ncbi:helix-turn-helix transcriptional regulator [Stenotrophomonas indicatrix]|uniref:helix-turn-helix transcriptional regulator n=1 Tax=Stenotrophomonas indicatrix TaxID=2045451 RepID=UPI0028EE6E95|nr:helix-turn-helix transcriptional regulator [Stenotrophomonas indicatrix]MDT9581270.1 helix-turn-helix transcriptional regulator [Stenotrophomonas indicatrix]
MNFSRRVRIARLSAGMTQQALAQRLCVTRTAIANWEGTARGRPATDRILRLAMVTGVSFEWLATGRGASGVVEPNATLPTEAEMIQDPLELRVLHAFRSLPQRELLRTVHWIEHRCGLSDVGS